MPGLPAEDGVKAHGRICYLGEDEASMEAEGKVLYQLKIEVEVLLSVADPHQLNVAIGVKDVPAEKIKRGVITAEELLGEKVFYLTLKKEYEFEEELIFVKAINYYIKGFSWNPEDDGVSFRGELVTILYYMAGESSGFRENRQQFGGKIDFAGLKKNVEVRLFPRVGYVTYRADGKVAGKLLLSIFFCERSGVIPAGCGLRYPGFCGKRATAAAKNNRSVEGTAGDS